MKNCYKNRKEEIRIVNAVSRVKHCRQSAERADIANKFNSFSGLRFFRGTLWHDKAMKCSRIKRKDDSTSPSLKLIRERKTGVNFLANCKLQIKERRGGRGADYD